MYKNYIFDLYGTLVDINTNEWSPYIWKKMQEFYGFYGANYNAIELKKAYFQTCKEMEEELKNVDYPEIQVEYVFQKLFKNKQINMDIENCRIVSQFFRIISTKYIKVYPGALEFLDKLKENGKKIYLLSNAQKTFTENEIKLVGLYDKFDGIVISSDEKCRKPSKSFFDLLMSRYKLNKKESIMIGNDWISDIEGAYNSGIDSVYLHTNISPSNTELSKVKAKYIIMGANYDKVSQQILHTNKIYC